MAQDGSHHQGMQLDEEVKTEMPALQELLALLVAERDQLGFVNVNLKYILAEKGNAYCPSRVW